MTVGITELPPEGMQLGGVALAGDAERGTKTTDGLSLLFTTAGITVQGPQPQIERLLVWSGLDSASCREKIVLPDGRNAAVMELTSGGQSIRFLLPLDTVTPGQAAYLDQALPAWLSRYKGAATAASPPPTPAAASTGAAVATGAAAAASSMGTSATGGAPVARGAAVAGGATAAARSAVAPTAAGTNGSARPAEAAPPPPPPPTPAPPAPPAPSTPLAGSTPAAPSAPLAGSTLPAPSSSLPAPAPPSASPAPAPSSAPGPSSAPPPPPGTAGWVVASDPLPSGVAWDTPAPESASTIAPEAPAKKTRGWRKDRTAPPPATEAAAVAAATVPPPGAVSPMAPPTQPPVDPVPLAIDPPLPPPPTEPAVAPGPVVWKPPIDPATGAALWDETSPSTVSPPPTKTRGWRKKSNVGAAGVAGTAAAGTAAATSGAAATIVDAPAPAGGGAAGAGPTPPPAPGSVQTGSTKPARKSSRATLAVLLVVLLVVIGGVAYFAVKRNNNTTSPPSPAPTATAPTPAPTAADSALAASINLRLTDLPAGWVRTATDQTAKPPTAAVAAQARASQALAACLGQPLVVVSGLFGLAGLPGQTAAVRSPSFEEGTDPGIQMVSQSTVMQTTGDAQSLTAPFLNPNFATCYGQFQSSLVSSAVPGSTAQVQTVQLPAPAGVKAFGYLTTYSAPNQGSQVVGQAFMIGGRVETLLEPSTNGPAVPSGPFVSAYDAVVGRLARSVNN